MQGRIMKTGLIIVALLAFTSAQVGAQQRLTSNVRHDAAEAEFVYDDIENFVQARQANLTVERLRVAMANYPEAYARIGENLEALRAQRPSIVEAYEAIKRTLPGAVFPPTYFVVAGHRGIGSGSIEGPLISIEKNTPQSIRDGDLEPTLVHEMVHMEQLAAVGEAYFDIFSGPGRTLLANSIREGGATWFAELITGGSRHKNEARDYYLAHEAELWEAFSRDMFGTDMGDWLWEKPANPEQPQDLGYAIGARIVQTYYESAADPGRAAMEIMAITDYPEFLELSGYP
jgi:hypothetical protein